jgi:PAS domain S-box-containing protein
MRITKRQSASHPSRFNVETPRPEDLCAALLEGSPDAIIVMDDRRRVVEFNLIAEQTFGYRRVEAIGRPLEELIVPARLRDGPENALGDCLAGLTNKGDLSRLRIELTAMRADGSELPIELTISAGRYPMPLYLCYARDMTEARRADAARRRSEQRLAEAQRVAQLGSWEYDAQTQEIAWSEQTFRLFGLEPDQNAPSYTSYLQCLHPEDAPRFEAAVVAAIEDGVPYELDQRVRLPDGEIRHIHTQGQPLYNAEGMVVKLIGAMVDITERHRAQEHIERQFERLTALRAIDNLINASFDLHVTLSSFVAKVTALLKVDAAIVSLCDPHACTLEFAVATGLRQRMPRDWRLKLDQGIAGRAALESRLKQCEDVRHAPHAFEGAPFLAEEGFVSCLAAPLLAKRQVKGVLLVLNRAPLAPDADWLDFLETLAGQAAIAIDNAHLFDGLQRSNMDLTLAYDATIEGWSRALDLRDRETEGHTQRVTDFTLRLARIAGISEAELVQVRRGALLHDIGKMGIPDNILLKPGPLTPEEWEIMRRHPQYALEMLSPIAFLRPALDIPYCHHEKWDGTGYPRGLKGESIPLAARLFAVVDVWDALRSDRPYRAGWPADRVRDHIAGLSGAHFDPHAVNLFLQLTTEVAIVRESRLSARPQP